MNTLVLDRRSIEDVAESVTSCFNDSRAGAYVVAALNLASAYESVVDVSCAAISSYEKALARAGRHIARANRAIANIRASEAVANRVIEFLRDELEDRGVDQVLVTLSSDDITSRDRIYSWAEAHRIYLR